MHLHALDGLPPLARVVRCCVALVLALSALQSDAAGDRVLPKANSPPGRSGLGRDSQRPPRLLLTGDILLGRQVQQQITRIGQSPWRALLPVMGAADWLVGNLEGALGNAGDCVGKPAELCFATPTTEVAWLQQAGFDALSLANNHSADLGPAGLGATVAALRRAGIAPLSYASSPQFFEVRGTVLGVVALSLVPDPSAARQAVPNVGLAAKLRLARRLANLVVVVVHWGYELQDWPSREQREQARWLVAQGADLIVGHHPHVVQAPACVAGRPVFYSLGNHLFDQKYPETKQGLLADCSIQDDRLHCGALRTLTPMRSSFPALAPDAEADGATLAGCGAPLRLLMHVRGYTLKPQSEPGGIRLQAWRDGGLRWRSPVLPLQGLEAGELAPAAADELLLALERHYSPLDGETAVRPYVYAVTEHGLLARWRGSALAWPLLDAVLLPGRPATVCALHRADSFLKLRSDSGSGRTMTYTWNGFGFTGASAAAGASACEAYFSPLVESALSLKVHNISNN